MDRRQLLVSGTSIIFSGLAGCLSTPAKTESNTDVDNGVRDNDTIITPSVSVDTVEQPGNHFTLSVDVKRDFSQNHPAKLSIVLQNDGDKRWLRTGGTLTPFAGSESSSASGKGSLLLDRYENAPIPDTPSSCWRYSGVVNYPDVLVHKSIKPGESLEHSMSLLAPAANDNSGEKTCMPSGVYQFQDSHERYDGPGGKGERIRPDNMYEFTLQLDSN